MSTRSALLAVLSLGPAYGHQLQAELMERTGRDRPINSGQIYATLDRLRRDELVKDAGTTDDGLPLYELTELGQIEAATWLTSPDGPSWDSMVQQVLLARSIPGADWPALVRGYRTLWITQGAEASGLASGATRILGEAALRWLSELPPAKAWEFRADRPKRGRRRAHFASS
ncbi:PadR family transcriptional regulator [Ruicaihuangia caeni]|uniref:PadR family transcriptional regulator n=1 Tax=Ruicaihuangia caeni TaxID=3042517 RepID=A0AAW6T6J3_9MICO|nr:PadR family transcriptional regulator [Klugiella sp. YN-L-19]MDI2097969.1 PadR family transcriptional regulator [Klugiella sp. YN-L-19]